MLTFYQLLCVYDFSGLRKRLQLTLKRPKPSSTLNSGSNSSNDQRRRNQYHLLAQLLQLLCLVVLQRLVEEEEGQQLLFLPREDLLGKSSVYHSSLVLEGGVHTNIHCLIKCRNFYWHCLYSSEIFAFSSALREALVWAQFCSPSERSPNWAHWLVNFISRDSVYH